MRAINLFAIVIMACVLPAEARIGETLEQCKARYGEAETQDAPPPAEQCYLFHKNGIMVVVALVGGRAAQIVYAAVSPRGESGELSGTQVTGLLAANSNGGSWTRSDDVGPTVYWMRSDRQVVAVYEPIRGYLTLTTVAHMNACKALKDEQEKQAISDF